MPDEGLIDGYTALEGETERRKDKSGVAEPEGSLLSPFCVPDSMGSLARHLVIPTLDFHREGIFRPSGNRKRLSSAPTLTLTLTLSDKTTLTIG